MLILVCGISFGAWQMSHVSAEAEIPYEVRIGISGRQLQPTNVHYTGPVILDTRTFYGKYIGWPFAYSQFGYSNGIRYSGEFDANKPINWLAVGFDLLIAATVTLLMLLVNALLEFQTAKPNLPG